MSYKKHGIPSREESQVLSSELSYDEIVELYKAMGFPKAQYLGDNNLRVYPTVASAKPQVLLEYFISVELQTTLVIRQFGDIARGDSIQTLASEVLTAVQVRFDDILRQESTDHGASSLNCKQKELDAFLDSLFQSQADKDFIAEDFNRDWPVSRARNAWEEEAIQAYRMINERKRSGEYVPSDGFDVDKLVAMRAKQILRLEHYDAICSKLAADHIEATMMESYAKIQTVPLSRLVGLFQFGPMGAGKSVAGAKAVTSGAIDRYTNLLIIDPDINLAFLASRRRDILKNYDISSGLDVSGNRLNSALLGEAGNLAFLIFRKWAKMCEQNKSAPNLFINYLALYHTEVMTFFKYGSEMVAPGFFIDKSFAVQSCEKRAKAHTNIPGRDPTQEEVLDTIIYVPNGLLKGLKAFAGLNLSVPIMDRNEKSIAPKQVGIINFKDKTIIIKHDLMESFINIRARSDKGFVTNPPTGDDYKSSEAIAAQAYLFKVLESGYTIKVVKERTENDCKDKEYDPLYTFSGDGKHIIQKPGDEVWGAKKPEIPEIVRNLCPNEIVGNIRIARADEQKLDFRGWIAR